MTLHIWRLNKPLSKRQVGRRLSAPAWEWSKIQATQSDCGLADGDVWTAGYGDSSACGRVWMHSNGIRVRGGLDIESDDIYACTIAQRLSAKEATPCPPRYNAAKKLATTTSMACILTNVPVTPLLLGLTASTTVGSTTLRGVPAALPPPANTRRNGTCLCVASLL